MADQRELEGLTVLVIDDHLDSLEIAEIALGRAGARVLAAPGAEAGLRFLDTQPVDVLVCDLAMPRLDGFDVVRAVRARRDEKRRIPAIAVSGSGAYDGRRALAAGFDAHAMKPIAPEALVEHVRRLVGRPAA